MVRGVCFAAVGKGNRHVPDIPEKQGFAFFTADQAQGDQEHALPARIGLFTVQHQPLPVKTAGFIRRSKAEDIPCFDFFLSARFLRKNGRQYAFQ